MLAVAQKCFALPSRRCCHGKSSPLAYVASPAQRPSPNIPPLRNLALSINHMRESKAVYKAEAQRNHLERILAGVQIALPVRVPYGSSCVHNSNLRLVFEPGKLSRRATADINVGLLPLSSRYVPSNKIRPLKQDTLVRSDERIISRVS